MDDDAFRQLLHQFDLSWKGYRKVRKGVKRHIGRHIKQLDCHDMAAYVQLLQEDGDERRECRRLLSVSISRFFRDRGLWECLEKDVLPELIRTLTTDRGKGIRVWSAGCACGEEVYSLKILWSLMEEKRGSLPSFQVVASDLNETCLERARAGIYPASSLKEVPEILREQFFRGTGKRWVVSEGLKRGITWQMRDLLGPPPHEEFHLIFLRNNLLTYYRDNVKVPAFRKVVDRLVPGGYLVVGCHEGIPQQVVTLLPLPGHPGVFRNIGT
jgi:chemotaxis protein methyltransferase CheR